MHPNNFSQLPIPKYYQVYLSLKEKMEEGTYSDGTAIPSERQLVDMYGVSRITIVKALDLLVQENLIDRRQGLGNFVCLPQDKHQPKLLTVALVIPGNLDGYISTVLTGMVRSASTASTQIQIMGPQIGKKNNLFFDELCCGDLDGVVIYPAENGWQEWVQQVIDSAVPVVLIDRYFPIIPCDTVVFNDEETAYNLTKELILHGMKRIAFIPQVEINTTSVINRLKGFQRAHLEFGLSIDEDLMWFEVYSHLTLGVDLMQDDSTEILDEHILRYNPDAIFAINHRVGEKFYYDLMTLQNRQMLAQLNRKGSTKPLNVSYNIGQAGVCDHEVLYQNPRYQRNAFQDGDALGKEAFQLLLGRINGNTHDPQAIQKIVPMRM